MPRRYEMGELVTMCKQVTDLENDENISTSEWKSMVSRSYGNLHATVSETGLRYFETTFPITSTGAISYDEPDDHFMTVGIDFNVDAAGRKRELIEVMAQERTEYAGLTGEAVAYAHVDDQIFLLPKPPSGHTFTMLYVPQPPNISDYADDEAVDVVTPDGEQLLLWGVAVMALHKQGRDERRAVSERDEARQRVFEWATMKNLNALRRPIIGGILGDERYPGDWEWS